MKHEGYWFGWLGVTIALTAMAAPHLQGCTDGAEEEVGAWSFALTTAGSLSCSDPSLYGKALELCNACGYSASCKSQISQILRSTGSRCTLDTSLYPPGSQFSETRAIQNTQEGGAVCPNLAPQCSDNIDNDGDGKVDWPADPQCTAPDKGFDKNEAP